MNRPPLLPETEAEGGDTGLRDLAAVSMLRKPRAIDEELNKGIISNIVVNKMCLLLPTLDFLLINNQKPKAQTRWTVKKRNSR